MLRKQVWVWLFLVLVLAQPAQAYLDPSAGSMMLQVILGGVAGLAIALKLFWARILLALGIGRRKPEEEGAADPETRSGA